MKTPILGIATFHVSWTYFSYFYRCSIYEEGTPHNLAQTSYTLFTQTSYTLFAQFPVRKGSGCLFSFT
jgi:hypothetical protein